MGLKSAFRKIATDHHLQNFQSNKQQAIVTRNAHGTTIHAGGGNDQVRAHQNRDGSVDVFINGERHHFSAEEARSLTIDLGSGNDTFTATGVPPGANGFTVKGQAGNDTLNGSHGADNLDGGEGNDNINAGYGNDTVTGGGGNDYINAGHGNDTVHGGAGNDYILGGAGNDTLMGGLGDDYVNGQAGHDNVYGNTDKPHFEVLRPNSIGDQVYQGNEYSNSATTKPSFNKPPQMLTQVGGYSCNHFHGGHSDFPSDMPIWMLAQPKTA